MLLKISLRALLHCSSRAERRQEGINKHEREKKTQDGREKETAEQGGRRGEEWRGGRDDYTSATQRLRRNGERHHHQHRAQPNSSQQQAASNLARSRTTASFPPPPSPFPSHQVTSHPSRLRRAAVASLSRGKRSARQCASGSGSSARGPAWGSLPAPPPPLRRGRARLFSCSVIFCGWAVYCERSDWTKLTMPSSTPPSVPPAPSVQPILSAAIGQSTRINLREIKSKIIKRIGPEQAKKYFQHLERFLSSKLSKNEFDKLCSLALGRENLPLHNHFVRSILRNASRANGPPSINAPKRTGDVNGSEHTLVPPVWNYGGALNQHVKDSKPFSSREDALAQQSSLNLDGIITRENCATNLSDLKRHTQVRQSEHTEPLTKRSRAEKTPLNFDDSPHGNGPIACRENLGEEIIHHACPVQAPLGIQFGPARSGWSGTKKHSAPASIISNDSSASCYELGEIWDTLSLRKRMEKMVEAEGLEGVSIECANLLNNGVDVLLKQLIGSCVKLIGARSQHDNVNRLALKQQLRHKIINGVSLQNHVHGQSGIIPPGTNSISMQDLRAVLELNPCLPGVNVSLLLEKINSRD